MPSTTTNLALRKPLATEAPDGAGQIGALADDIDAALGSYRDSGGIRQRLIGGTWKNWDSNWIDQTTPITGFVGGANPTSGNGWVFNFSRYRYVSGKVRLKFQLYLVGSGAAANQQINVGLPVAAADGGSFARGKADLTGSGAASYQISGSASGSTLYLTSVNSTGQIVNTTYNVPFVWHVNDVLTLEFEYDPA